VVFIGWYALAQLSVVNIFTFTSSLGRDFKWDTFLMDPMMFILWTFVAATLLLWGRGVYCGWLCPFGAMQELINEVSRKLRVPQFELPWAVHERLWSIKYLILLVLFGISLHSLSTAEVYAEVEPFKTAVTTALPARVGLRALRPGILLAISVVNRKFFCRYMCPWVRAWPYPRASACSTGSSGTRNAARRARSAPTNARCAPSIRTDASTPTNATTAWTAR
jgi:NosR/NirI family transcriptional regulator, nitrous oxide reductase regulator